VSYDAPLTGTRPRVAPSALVRATVFMVVLAGCKFDPAGLAGGGDDVDPPQPDAAIVEDDAAPPAFCADDPALIACYDFENGGIDGSAYGNHATLTDATTEEGKAGNGLALSVRSTSLVTVAESASLEIPGPMTVELWLRADEVPPLSANNRAGLVDHNGQWGLFLTSTMEVRCVVGGGASVTGLAVTLGEWTHLACVYDRVTVQLYQDGVAGPSINATGENSLAATDGIRIGQDSPSGDPLTGLIDQVRIWNVARQRM
jgi:hypothetical protein